MALLYTGASQALISTGITRYLVKMQILIHCEIGTIIPTLEMGKLRLREGE